MDENTTTTPTAVTASVWEDVLTAREVLARLARTDVSMLPDDDVDGTAHPAEEVLRMAAVLPQALAGQIRARGLDTDRGARSTESYLRSVLRIDIGEAKARMAAVDRFHPRPQPSGEVLPPRFAKVADALCAGEVSMTHAAVIARSLERLPTAVPAETVDDAEAHLVERAKAWHPAGVATLAMKRESVLDPDGCLEDERERKQRRGMTVGKDLHGMHEAVLMLDPESANELMVHVQPLATPQTADDGSPDPRTAAQRRLDALMQLVRWGSENTAMPKPGGRPVHVAVTTTLAELYDRAGLAYLNNGDPLSIQDLLAKAGETDVALTVFGTAGEVLHHGRAQRLAPTGLRHAVIARDKGCQFDACDAPPLYCDAHHVTWWSRGGATDIDNLMLLCGRHHSLIHKEHWRAAMLDGVPHVIPPPWIDPHQKPRRNRMHDPPPRPG